MSLRFQLCPDLAWAYTQLEYDPEANCKYVLIPLQTMYWLDEHPHGSMAVGCHLECHWSIDQLLVARQQIWDHGGVSEDLADLWADALALIPEWPGFQRIDIDDATRAKIDEYAEEGFAFLNEARACKEFRVHRVDRLPEAGHDWPRLE